ncbi:G1 family glutamic endopeptidase [Dyella psychrodurans]|nr:G1 family glutamic endopeptidase [Dyella psychrodurans]
MKAIFSLAAVSLVLLQSASVVAASPADGTTATPSLGMHESLTPDAGFITADGYIGHPMIKVFTKGDSTELAPPSTTTVTSGNWGGAAQSDSTHNFTSVGAIFNIPTSVTCSSTSNLVAEWVGLNGYSNGTVQQTGVAISCATGAPTFQAWYEMYPAPPVYISTATYPISPGDHIIGSVTNNNGSYTLAIWNYSKNWSFSTTQQSSQTTASSAEAIVEVPSGATNPNYGNIPYGAMTGNVTPGGTGVAFRQPQSGDAPIYKINTVNVVGGYRATSTGVLYGNELSPNMQVYYASP